MPRLAASGLGSACAGPAVQRRRASPRARRLARIRERVSDPEYPGGETARSEAVDRMIGDAKRLQPGLRGRGIAAWQDLSGETAKSKALLHLRPLL
jgi:hypothetical protein